MRWRRTTLRKRVLAWARVFGVLAVIGAGMFAAAHVAGNDTALSIVRTYGYAGVFGISIVSGFNLVVPIPAVAFMPVFSVAGLGFWTSVLVITVGVTIADTTAFLLGRSGRLVLEQRQSKVLSALERMRTKGRAAPLVVMFVYACVAPLPNEMLAVPLGLLGYRVRQIVPPLLFGNLVFNSLASLGVLGVFGAF